MSKPTECHECGRMANCQASASILRFTGLEGNSIVADVWTNWYCQGCAESLGMELSDAEDCRKVTE